ncbi:MAG: F0F1 ATP synthase subunit A [Actinobacteria bacterium]|nr:F0F1 ATP synthase subunit A [Actinomycetota bacterium]
MNSLARVNSRISAVCGAMIATLAVALAVPASALAEINEDFKPQNEFKLDPWVDIHIFGIDMSLNKGVLMLVLAALCTGFTVALVSRKMNVTGKPSRVQAAVEIAYDVANDTITNRNIHDNKVAKRWFPFLATLFLFIWFSNILGLIPLPTNTEHTVSLFGLNVPTFALYGATANVAVPLTLALIVWLSSHVEGIRAKGPIGYVKGWIPGGTPAMVLPIIVPVEILSQFLRLVSLTARLFANMLAGHMIILIMGGGMVVLLGIPYIFPLTATLGVFIYFLDVMLVATLQAFIFATLSAIYLGGAVASEH